jgi:4-oxalocrotonate tautomerase family enzyme
MPYIQCHIPKGLTKDRKVALIKDVIKVTHEAVGSDPKIINVLLIEHEREEMSISGRVYDDC